LPKRASCWARRSAMCGGRVMKKQGWAGEPQNRRTNNTDMLLFRLW
jgi:hypothetical protein